eukprot:jgi/Mesen1/6998/ME000365S06136
MSREQHYVIVSALFAASLLTGCGHAESVGRRPLAWPWSGANSLSASKYSSVSVQGGGLSDVAVGQSACVEVTPRNAEGRPIDKRQQLTSWRVHVSLARDNSTAVAATAHHQPARGSHRFCYTLPLPGVYVLKLFLEHSAAGYGDTQDNVPVKMFDIIAHDSPEKLPQEDCTSQFLASSHNTHGYWTGGRYHPAGCHLRQVSARSAMSCLGGTAVAFFGDSSLKSLLSVLARHLGGDWSATSSPSREADRSLRGAYELAWSQSYTQSSAGGAHARQAASWHSLQTQQRGPQTGGEAQLPEGQNPQGQIPQGQVRRGQVSPQEQIPVLDLALGRRAKASMYGDGWDGYATVEIEPPCEGQQELEVWAFSHSEASAPLFQPWMLGEGRREQGLPWLTPGMRFAHVVAGGTARDLEAFDSPREYAAALRRYVGRLKRLVQPAWAATPGGGLVWLGGAAVQSSALLQQGAEEYVHLASLDPALYNDLRRRAFDRAAFQVMEEEGVAWLDARPVSEPRADLTRDGLHYSGPSDEALLHLLLTLLCPASALAGPSADATCHDAEPTIDANTTSSSSSSSSLSADDPPEPLPPQDDAEEEFDPENMAASGGGGGGGEVGDSGGEEEAGPAGGSGSAEGGGGASARAKRKKRQQQAWLPPDLLDGMKLGRFLPGARRMVPSLEELRVALKKDKDVGAGCQITLQRSAALLPFADDEEEAAAAQPAEEEEEGETRQLTEEQARAEAAVERARHGAAAGGGRGGGKGDESGGGSGREVRFERATRLEHSVTKEHWLKCFAMRRDACHNRARYVRACAPRDNLTRAVAAGVVARCEKWCPSDTWCWEANRRAPLLLNKVVQRLPLPVDKLPIVGTFAGGVFVSSAGDVYNERFLLDPRAECYSLISAKWHYKIDPPWAAEHAHKSVYVATGYELGWFETVFGSLTRLMPFYDQLLADPSIMIHVRGTHGVGACVCARAGVWGGAGGHLGCCFCCSAVCSCCCSALLLLFLCCSAAPLLSGWAAPACASAACRPSVFLLLLCCAPLPSRPRCARHTRLL